MPAEAVRWLLDMNIVSELARERPSAEVMRRFAQHEHELALPTVVWHELLYGVVRLPVGQRRQRLSDFVEQVAGALPTLLYDAAVARVHVQLRADSAARGRVLCEPDAPDCRNGADPRAHAGDPQRVRLRRRRRTAGRELVRIRRDLTGIDGR